MSKRKHAMPQLISPPRWLLNVAILGGGVVGFVVQDQRNMDNEQAFLVTAGFVFLAVIAVTFGYLAYTRLQENRS